MPAKYPRSLVTIVIPAFNASPWLDEAIASALAQTYSPVEVIVADNGSTDNTREIAASFGSLVRLVHAPTRGAGAARNAALNDARGSFLQFLDADDVLVPWKIQRQISEIQRTGADVIWGPFWTYERVSRNGPFVARFQRAPAIHEDIARDLLGPNGWIQIGSPLFRRNARIAPIRFANNMWVDDVDYMLQVISAGTRWIRGEGDSGLLYREHDQPRVSTDQVERRAIDCVTNARTATRLWRGRGELTRSRVDVLVDVYCFALRQLFRDRRDLFYEYLAELQILDSRFARRLPPRLRFLSKVIGYPAAEHVALHVRAAKKLWRELDPRLGRLLRSAYSSSGRRPVHQTQVERCP